MTKRKKVQSEPSPSSNLTPVQINTSPDNSEAEKIPPKHLSYFLGITVFILSGLALLLSWYTLQKNRHLARTTSQQLNAISAQLTLLNQHASNEKPLEDTIHLLNQTQNKLEERVKVIGKYLESHQEPDQNQEWTLSKARYYLELAQMNACWGQEQKTTLILLQKADNLLKSFPPDSLKEVRQAISEEMAQIKASPQNENIEILKQLESMQTALPELPFKKRTLSAEKNLSSAPEGRFWNNIRQLSKLVVVRQNNNLGQTLLPMHQTLLLESIRMELQEAQWAVIQNNFIIYSLAIEQAVKRTQETFDVESEITQNFITSLESLQKKLPIKTQFHLENSLQRLNQFIETQLPQSSTSSDSSAPGSLSSDPTRETSAISAPSVSSPSPSYSPSNKSTSNKERVISNDKPKGETE